MRCSWARYRASALMTDCCCGCCGCPTLGTLPSCCAWLGMPLSAFMFRPARPFMGGLMPAALTSAITSVRWRLEEGHVKRNALFGGHLCWEYVQLPTRVMCEGAVAHRLKTCQQMRAAAAPAGSCRGLSGRQLGRRPAAAAAVPGSWPAAAPADWHQTAGPCWAAGAAAGCGWRPAAAPAGPRLRWSAGPAAPGAAPGAARRCAADSAAPARRRIRAGAVRGVLRPHCLCHSMPIAVSQPVLQIQGISGDHEAELILQYITRAPAFRRADPTSRSSLGQVLEVIPPLPMEDRGGMLGRCACCMGGNACCGPGGWTAPALLSCPG